MSRQVDTDFLVTFDWLSTRKNATLNGLMTAEVRGFAFAFPLAM